MNQTHNRLGLWASAVSFATFLLYTLCFVWIAATQPAFAWTTAADYVIYVQTHSQTPKLIAMALMILFSLSFLVQLECLRERVAAPRAVYLRIATHLAVAFAVLVSVNYFIQLGAVRLMIAAGQTQGIEHLVQANPTSAVFAVNLLGWTVFLGASCVFAALALGPGRPERAMRLAFLANGAMMLTSAVAYVLGIQIILAIFMFLGLGGAIIVESAAMCRYFRRAKTAQ